VEELDWVEAGNRYGSVARLFIARDRWKIMKDGVSSQPKVRSSVWRRTDGLKSLAARDGQWPVCNLCVTI
jgi:hypothetical protein